MAHQLKRRDGLKSKTLGDDELDPQPEGESFPIVLCGRSCDGDAFGRWGKWEAVERRQGACGL